MKLEGKVAAVTGAASGIGRALAISLVSRGAEVALSDVDAEGLERTASLCKNSRTLVSTSIVDVADRDAMLEWSADVVARHGRVNLIANNAGVAMSAAAEEQSIDDFRWLMNINFWGVVHGTEAFLPLLRHAGEGHIVNISSVFGLMSIPSQSAYNASKFAVRGYSDSLRMELEMTGSPVSVTTVHPGGIKTAIARNARGQAANRDASDQGLSTGSVDEIAERFDDSLARTDPEKAASQILRAVERNRRRALIGPDAPLFDFVARLPAAVSQRITMIGGRRALGSALPRT